MAVAVAVGLAYWYCAAAAAVAVAVAAKSLRHWLTCVTETFCLWAISATTAASSPPTAAMSTSPPYWPVVAENEPMMFWQTALKTTSSPWLT